MKRPTQLEMMAYLDGEQSLLGEDRAREVSEWFASTEGQSYQASRRRSAALLGSLLREQVAAPPVDLADDIMAAISREPRVEAPRESRPVPALRVITGGRGREEAPEAPPPALAPLHSSPSEERIRAIGGEPRGEASPAVHGPHGPSHRSPRSAALAVLLAAVAVAAALLVWWRSPAAPTVRYEAGVGLQPSSTPGAGGGEQADPSASAMLAIATTLDDDEIFGDDGSEIDSVDFGSQSGAIFYVQGKAHTNSAVIWVDDEEPRP
jgi:hypothetical protein